MSRNRQRHPSIGGVVNRGQGDTTKQGRKRKAKHDVVEMNKIARQRIKIPTQKEVQEIDNTKQQT
ncbi:hypothetical protein LCGC14_1521400 [marine sediment metagenome]|uniref:Uncharacterized protein n=1 Tax=marine sediment metagenome TaxID=412755 RepID=A0A0F9LE46_9ZZZZ